MEQYYPLAFQLVLYLPFLFLFKKFVFAYLSREKSNPGNTDSGFMTARLQAHERMLVFLERIKPVSLFKELGPSLTITETLFLIQKKVQAEWEFNLGSQLYISKNTWELIASSKENVLRILESTAMGMKDYENSQDFKTFALINYVNAEDLISEAILQLRKDAFAIE